MILNKIKKLMCAVLTAALCMLAMPNVLADENTNTRECVKITADYDDSGKLLNVDFETITFDKIIHTENTPSHKVFYWESLDSMKPIEITMPSPSPTISPIASPTATPTASPTVTPTVSPSSEPASDHWDFTAYSGNAAIDNITETKNELYKYTCYLKQ